MHGSYIPREFSRRQVICASGNCAVFDESHDRENDQLALANQQSMMPSFKELIKQSSSNAFACRSADRCKQTPMCALPHFICTELPFACYRIFRSPTRPGCYEIDSWSAAYRTARSYLWSVRSIAPVISSRYVHICWFCFDLILLVVVRSWI